MGIYNLIISKKKHHIRDSHKFTKYDCLKIPEFKDKI